MAAGFAYPAEFQTAEGQIVVGGTVQFTDEEDQPGSGLPAVVYAGNLPTMEPSDPGYLWNDAGTVKVSS